MIHRRNLRSTTLLGLLLVLTLLVGACAAPAPSTDTGAAPAEGGEAAAEPAAMGRGAGGTLTLLYWQAASTMNPYLSGGTKDIHAASMSLEPLARYDSSGNMVPWLAEEIPTLENGGVSEDLMSITWKLKPGILWSDGTPLTAEDAVFTGEYCMNEEMGCNAAVNFGDVESIEAVDELTIQINFTKPKPFPYGPLVGQTSPVLQKAQFQDCLGARAQECTEQNFAPVGTGPYIVDDFRANDTIVLSPNPNYREEDKPYFSQVTFKGGGDAASAARAVLETGEADYAWNLQVEPQILADMEARGVGTIVNGFATAVERLILNQTNPDPALGDQRSEWTPDDPNPHPFLSDINVRKAMSMAIDRSVIAEQLYGPAGTPGCNLVPNPEIYRSPNNDDCIIQDMEGAKALLDEAGYVDTDGDGIREMPDGQPLSVLYQTSVNPVRQKTQALVKQWWEELGIATELKSIDAGVFFGGDPASPDTYGKFFADVQMYTNTFDGTDPEVYMPQWTCDEIARAENQWLGNNIPRWCNPDYATLVEELANTAGLDARAALVIEMNDMIVQDYVEFGLVTRGDVSAHSNTLQGVDFNPWDSELWNIADWTRAE
jgi:peptide/nickel transport system substrate-binding protein